MTWDRTDLHIGTRKVQATAPVIISASRSTDIPAFYSDRLMERIRAGYCTWINPFNKKTLYISFAKAEAFVFWSKNPRPMLKHLDELDSHNFAYYFQFSVNDYEREGFEPCLPSLRERIDTFVELSERLGKHRVIWRFDPLIITASTPVPELLDRISRIGEIIARHTTKLVFSFVDIAAYRKVSATLKRHSICATEPMFDDMNQLAEGLRNINKDWGITLATCGEVADFRGIQHNKCIDDVLLHTIAPYNSRLNRFLGFENTLFNERPKNPKSLKDKGQRLECGCIISKDIGMYNTCPHNCVYCYANTSVTAVESRIAELSSDEETVCRL